MTMDARIPVTIITGFLGAGKTTLLNRLISGHPDRRIAIIENEFGDIPIDQDLVVSAEEGIFELSNGCICCTLNDDLVKLLGKLIDRAQDFDHLVIETTGVAEPDGVAAAFISEPAVQEHFRLDGTVCVVAAPDVEDLIDSEEEYRRQITFADLILLNKSAEVSAPVLEKAQQMLSEANPFASIQVTNYSEISENLLDLKAYERQSVEEKLAQIPAHDHGHHHHHHTSIRSHSFELDTPFDFLKFRHWVNVLLLIQGKRIYRIKGILHFEHQDHQMIFQSVRQMHVFQKGAPWGDDQPRKSRLVFIGPDLKRAPLERSLRSCLASK
jgi:G3E family GTPase